jgi:hypothetical protein
MDLVPEVAEDAGPAATADQDALAAANATPEHPPTDFQKMINQKRFDQSNQFERTPEREYQGKRMENLFALLYCVINFNLD